MIRRSGRLADLVDTVEAARRAGVPARTVHTWRTRHAGFPEPDYRFSVGPVWQWHRIERWLRDTGRTPRIGNVD